MSIKTDWVVIDTNVWIFGLRKQPEHPECARLLLYLNRLYVKIPRQILLELQVNLNIEEMNALYRLWNRLPDHTDIRWSKADPGLIEKYRRIGCKLGDAAVSAHLDEMGVGILISENRDFLEELEGLPFKVLNSAEALEGLG